mmetsp:Transcript_2265/g.3308  ORF Transcript_2265/g.3308 Transcript_2265/m.3308 type:complete len:127 (-) Transcript_2265:2847-3227(-)
MCHAVECVFCHKTTWEGCGLHIDAAMSHVSMEMRCAGWTDGQCPDMLKPRLEQAIRNTFGEGLLVLDIFMEKDINVVVVTDAFDGLSRVDRHRKIFRCIEYAGLPPEKRVVIKAWTKHEYEKKRGR